MSCTCINYMYLEFLESIPRYPPPIISTYLIHEFQCVLSVCIHYIHVRCHCDELIGLKYLTLQARFSLCTVLCTIKSLIIVNSEVLHSEEFVNQAKLSYINIPQ